jgi:hypothetical protein
LCFCAQQGNERWEKGSEAKEKVKVVRGEWEGCFCKGSKIRKGEDSEEEIVKKLICE